MFQSCLVCTDLTDGLYRLVEFVPDLAKGGLNKIIFFTSVPLWEEGEVPRVDTEKVQQAQELLDKALSNVPQGVEVKVEVASGKPLDTIPRVLQNNQVDVILTGTPIKSLLEQKFFGSTSVGLSKLTEKPLTIIRPQLITTYTQEELSLRCQHLWRYLLIPYNDSKSAQYLIEQIELYVKQCPTSSLTKCMLISVVDKVVREEVLKEYRIKEAQEKLESVKAQLEALGITVNTEVREGNPLQEIMDAALEFDISAIATATTSGNSLLEFTAPSFANDVIRRSWFPVLFFSPKK
ncbi:MAG: universal stress protein [Xenococcaceae cyanobacterium MO_207.B15]|nr:universal stress protein [Xenococcaceae cyanobacterium MO_207.B15]MDJ0743520.1 universal stress protein [Xenococcaceae cyanobacterium MO_167.B27]